MWDGTHDWKRLGDEWSKDWGDAANQWYASLFPRLRGFLPVVHLVEIAPGFGRWTQFLLDYCDYYTGVDLSQECVVGCRQRFAAAPKASFEVNDGRSLDAIDNGSADLVFSFDSLVHAEADVVDGYLRSLREKLSPNGIALIHHSNLAGVISARYSRRLAEALPAAMRRSLETARLLPSHHWRARSVSAILVEEICRSAGLACIGQEIVNWGGPLLIDCISVIAQPGSRWQRSNFKVTNRHFHDEALSAGTAYQVYR